MFLVHVVLGALTSFTPTLVICPGGVLTPLSSGKGVSSAAWTATRAPTLSQCTHQRPKTALLSNLQVLVKVGAFVRLRLCVGQSVSVSVCSGLTFKLVDTGTLFYMSFSRTFKRSCRSYAKPVAMYVLL